MSSFMVCIEAPGLIESPPESNVMPLPTSARCVTALAGAYVSVTRRGGLSEPRPTPRMPPQRLLGEALLVPDRHLDVGAGVRRDGLGEVGRAQVAGRRVDPVAGGVDRRGDGRGALDGLGRGRLAGERAEDHGALELGLLGVALLLGLVGRRTCRRRAARPRRSPRPRRRPAGCSAIAMLVAFLAARTPRAVARRRSSAVGSSGSATAMISGALAASPAGNVTVWPFSPVKPISVERGAPDRPCPRRLGSRGSGRRRGRWSASRC